MQTIHVSADFPLSRRMRKAVRRGKLHVVRDGGERSGLGGEKADKKSPLRRTESMLVCAAGGERRLSGRVGGKVFIYWDNSNIFQRARDVAEKREGTAAKHFVRINFNGLMRLARAGREMGKTASVAASVPPLSEEALWDQMAAHEDVRLLEKFDRRGGGEQGVPDQRLQLGMLADAMDALGAPGVAVLLSGDGGFLPFLERMRDVGWRVELLAWRLGCKEILRKWAQKNGVFVPLEDYYEEVTFLKKPLRRKSADLDLSARPIAE